jgi:serine protease AprX
MRVGIVGAQTRFSCLRRRRVKMERRLGSQLLLILATAGCGSEEPGLGEIGQLQTRAGELDTEGNSYVEVITDREGRAVSKRKLQVRPALASGVNEAPKPAAALPAALPQEKVQQKLRGLIDEAKAEDQLEVVIAIEPTSQFSTLPALDESLPRDAAFNVAKLAEREAAFQTMAAPRREALRRWSDRIRGQGGKVLEEHVIGSSVVARMPAKMIDTLATDREVQHVASRHGERPPADGISGNDPVNARAVIGTDPYVSAGYTGNWGYIGLLDTGVRSSHVMLTGPSAISLESDCYRGGASCRDSAQPGYSTTDTYGHGTSSAGVMAGSVNLGARWRGVTTAQSRIDSWKISDDNGGTDSPSVLRAYDRARHWSEWAIAATIQVNESPGGSLSSGANDLYDLGIAVFASNGNFTGDARAPANANRALGIGGYDVNDLTNLSGNTGTPDGRHKPDLRTPSNVETASAKTTAGGACDNCVQVYGGTSCAGPVAVATASVLRHYLIDNGIPREPGHIYAGLLAFGNESPNDTNGAGRITLASPSCSAFMVGQVTLAQDQIAYIDVPVSAGGKNLKAAIWWPTQYQSHRDIDLRVENPSGTLIDWSQGTPSVFERVQVNGALQTGTWRVRIKGYSVPFGSQKVFYFIHRKTC